MRRIALSCEWCLDQYNHQGWYGESFIRALAAAAGLQVAKPEPDCNGVDFHISATREIDGDFPMIMAQVKSWSAPLERPGGWRYDRLTQKRFNALAGRNRQVSPVLVRGDGPGQRRFLLPCRRKSSPAKSRRLLGVARRRGSIEDAACKSRVAVTVPQQNLLTAESLKALCEDGSAAGRRAS